MTQHVVHAITEGTTYSGCPQNWAFENLSFSTVERGPKSASEALVRVRNPRSHRKFSHWCSRAAQRFYLVDSACPINSLIFWNLEGVARVWQL